MHQPGPTADVIPFLRKRAERAHARYDRLYSAELTEDEIDRHLHAVLDYAYENVSKRTGGKPRRRNKKEAAEILSRVEEICGPPQPLPPELDALAHYLVRSPEARLELWESLHASNPTD